MHDRVLVAALLLAAALPAYAGEDAPLPPLTPKGEFLVMTQDDATSSSKCIGNPVTPMCAVETKLACDQRKNAELCELAIGAPLDPEFRRLAYENQKPDATPFKYRVVHREVLTDRRFPWRPSYLRDRPNEISMRVGDVRIDILDVTPEYKYLSRAYCGLTSPRVAYIVRKRDRRWLITDWRPLYLVPCGR
jgi:hypothetical protein